jgi:heavy metal translocating P-type ATPase
MDVEFNEIQGVRPKVEGEGCGLCGLPVGRSRAMIIRDGKRLLFCCWGCRLVYEILMSRPEGPPVEPRAEGIFRACVEEGIIPRDLEDLVARKRDPRSRPRPKSLGVGQAQVLNVRIMGMWCPACARLIQEFLRRQEGIEEVRVSFISDLARVRYLPHLIGRSRILERIRALGYEASVLEEEGLEYTRIRERLLMRLGISAFLTSNVMMISFAIYGGFFQELSKASIALMSYPTAFMTLAVILYGGLPILKRGFASVRYLSPTMESLVSTGILASFAYSIIQTLNGGIHLYFDTACMLVTLVLLGRYLEARTKEKVGGGLAALYAWARSKVRLGVGREERWVPPDRLKPGDRIAMRAGERIPLDGVVVDGRAQLDESVITGEPGPVSRGWGDQVIGGSKVLTGDLTLEVVRVGPDSSLGAMIQQMEEALLSKGRMEEFADRVMNWLVPAVFALAMSTALWLLGKGATVDEAILRAVTILVITCPCALGIAVPLAKVATVGLLRQRGILVRDASALDRIGSLNAMVLDKTGTLTRGKFTFEGINVPGMSEDEALRIVAAVEASSRHHLAREILREARRRRLRIPEAENFREIQGLGATGRVDGLEVAVGSSSLMKECGHRLSREMKREAEELASMGCSTVFFGWGGRVRGFIFFRDPPRPKAASVIDKLKEMGLSVWLVSGDREETTAHVAMTLGIERSIGGALPKDKVSLIRSLQGEGRAVGFFGDGINDMPAMARSDVGIAMGEGAAVAASAADIIILSKDTSRLLDVITISRLASRTMRQNLWLSFIYNAVGIPLAVFGFLNPLVAVTAMFASSLTVMGNTLRLLRRGSIPIVSPP